MRIARFLLLVPALMLLTAARGDASILLFAELTNSAENPPTSPTTSGGAARPASFGVAFFELNDAQTAMTFKATIFNIDCGGLTPLDPSDDQTVDPNDDLRNAHIHAAMTVTPTTNGPVVWGFIGAPFNDNMPNDVVVTPFASGVGGPVSGKWDAGCAAALHPRWAVLHQLPHRAVRRRRGPRQHRVSPGTWVAGAAGTRHRGSRSAPPKGLTSPPVA
jgi:hypothetical protein